MKICNALLIYTIGFLTCLMSAYGILIPYAPLLPNGYITITPLSYWLGILVQLSVILMTARRGYEKLPLMLLCLLSISTISLPFFNDQYPPSHDSYAHLFRVNKILDSGLLQKELGYMEWPNAFLWLAGLKALTGLPDFLLAGRIFALYQKVLLIPAFYLLFRAVSRNKFMALLATAILCMGGSYLTFHPDSMGIIVLVLLLFTFFKGRFEANRRVMLLSFLLLLSSTYYHHYETFTSVVVLSGILLGSLIVEAPLRRVKNFPSHISARYGAIFVVAALVIFIHYNFLVTGFIDPAFIIRAWAEGKSPFGINPLSFEQRPSLLLQSALIWNTTVVILGSLGIFLSLKRRSHFLIPLLSWGGSILILIIIGQIEGGIFLKPSRIVDIGIPAMVAFAGFFLCSLAQRKVYLPIILSILLLLSITGYTNAYFWRQSFTFYQEEYALGLFLADAVNPLNSQIHSDRSTILFLRYNLYVHSGSNPSESTITSMEDLVCSPRSSYIVFNGPKLEFRYRYSHSSIEEVKAMLNGPSHNLIYITSARHMIVYIPT